MTSSTAVLHARAHSPVEKPVDSLVVKLVSRIADDGSAGVANWGAPPCRTGRIRWCCDRRCATRPQSLRSLRTQTVLALDRASTQRISAALLVLCGSIRRLLTPNRFSIQLLVGSAWQQETAVTIAERGA